MEPSIDILSKNIILNKNYDRVIKENYILTINRISNFKTSVQQLYRQNSFHILYNMFHEEILFLHKQKEVFKNKLKGNSQIILDEYINEQIDLYNHYLNKL